MKIHLIIPNRHRTVAEEVATLLSEHTVTFASKDTPQDTKPEEILRRNLFLLEQADLVLPVFIDAGKDFNFELGYALAKGKVYYALNYNADKDNLMAFYSVLFLPLEEIRKRIENWK